MKRRVFVAGTLGVGALGMSACGPAAPTYQDPLSDLTSARASQAPENAPVHAGPTQAVTFGSNVERFIKYHDDGIKFAASMGAGEKILKDGSPQYLIDGGVAILRQRYPAIRPVNDLASAQREHIATTFVLDIQTKAGMFPGDRTTADLILIAVDAQQKPISRIQSQGYYVIRPYVPPDAKIAYDMALADFKTKIDSLCS